jgi:hypothetical protein
LLVSVKIQTRNIQRQLSSLRDLSACCAERSVDVSQRTSHTIAVWDALWKIRGIVASGSRFVESVTTGSTFEAAVSRMQRVLNETPTENI